MVQGYDYSKSWQKAIKTLSSWYADNPSQLCQLHPGAFERLVALLLEQEGFSVKLLGSWNQPDGGVDIIAVQNVGIAGEYRIAVQCKKTAHNRKISARPIRELVGVLDRFNAHAGVIVTTSKFTNPAKKEAQNFFWRISLKDYGDIVKALRDMWPANLPRPIQRPNVPIVELMEDSVPPTSVDIDRSSTPEPPSVKANCSKRGSFRGEVCCKMGFFAYVLDPFWISAREELTAAGFFETEEPLPVPWELPDGKLDRNKKPAFTSLFFFLDSSVAANSVHVEFFEAGMTKSLDILRHRFECCGHLWKPQCGFEVKIGVWYKAEEIMVLVVSEIDTPADLGRVHHEFSLCQKSASDWLKENQCKSKVIGYRFTGARQIANPISADFLMKI